MAASGSLDGNADATEFSDPEETADATAAAPRHRGIRPPRQRRRVTTEAVPGTDPAPSNEPPRHVAGENDDQLRRDKPPHWG